MYKNINVVCALRFVIFVTLITSLSSNDNVIEITVYEESDPIALANTKCNGMKPSCLNAAIPLIQLYKHQLFGANLTDWKFVSDCK
jgi:hypothetical protein